MQRDGHHEVARLAGAVCETASPLAATAAAPLWRALNAESEAWLFTLMPDAREH